MRIDIKEGGSWLSPIIFCDRLIENSSSMESAVSDKEDWPKGDLRLVRGNKKIKHQCLGSSRAAPATVFSFSGSSHA